MTANDAGAKELKATPAETTATDDAAACDNERSPVTHMVSLHENCF